MYRLLMLFLVAFALSGCASIFSGTTQDVAIRTTPGAKYTVTNDAGSQVASGVVGDDALARMNLVRSVGYFSPHSYRVKLSKPGFRPATVAIEPGINGWYFANIALGGFVGMVIVDPLTGAMFRMVPQVDDLPLQPTGEDIGALDAEAAAIARTRNYPVSRHDYTARQQARAAQCEPIGNPEISGLKTYEEKLQFTCRGGQQLTVRCRSTEGCVRL